MIQNQRQSRWNELLLEAYSIIDYVNHENHILEDWTFGGGTAMMLQINHRESHDVDLFIDDPQLLPYLNAAVADMSFNLGEPSYNGDGSGHLKVAFAEVGEIDFIVTGHILDNPSVSKKILGRQVNLETIPEIIAKKVRFRGSHIQPRDVFDIAAACEAGFQEAISEAVAEIEEYKIAAADCLRKLNPDYVDNTISQLMIKSDFEQIVPNARVIATEVLTG